MEQQYSIPGAIVLAGVLVAGAIVLTRTPVGERAAAPTSSTPSPAVAAETAPPRITVRPVDPATDHIRGDVNATVTLVEYSDTECPFCKQFHSVLQQALREYQGRVRWVYRHYPLDSLHSKARNEALATECAAAQGKFWEYLDELFARTPSNNGLDPAELPKIAAAVSLDGEAFASCLSAKTYASRVQDDLDDASRAGGRGTPHTIILSPQGETLPFSGAQPYENLKQVIDGLLAAD